MSNYHPNKNRISAPWMRCVMVNKGGLTPHDLVSLCCVNHKRKKKRKKEGNQKKKKKQP